MEDIFKSYSSNVTQW